MDTTIPKEEHCVLTASSLAAGAGVGVGAG